MIKADQELKSQLKDYQVDDINGAEIVKLRII